MLFNINNISRHIGIPATFSVSLIGWRGGALPWLAYSIAIFYILVHGIGVGHLATGMGFALIVAMD